MQNLQREGRGDQDQQVRGSVEASAGLGRHAGAPGQPAVDGVGQPSQEQTDKRGPALPEHGRDGDGRREGAS